MRKNTMNLKHINTFILLALFILASAVTYGSTVDDYREQYRIFDDEPLFTDDLVIIEAEDGRKVHIRKLNPYYDENVRIPTKSYYVTNIGWQTFGQNECYYFVLCEDEINIINYFDQENNYLQKYADKMRLELYKDYDVFSSYHFTYLFDTEKDYLRTLKVWFAGDICVTLSDINDKYRDLYQDIRNVCFDIFRTEVVRCVELFEKKIDYGFNMEAYYAARFIIVFEDEEISVKIRNELNKAQFNQFYSENLVGVNLTISLPFHAKTVTEFKNTFKLVNKTLESSPNIEGELPRTEEELEEFINWKLNNYASDNPSLTDSFDNPVKFEVVKEGLKVISAGKDGIFDTKDDQFFIRTYESAGM